MEIAIQTSQMWGSLTVKTLTFGSLYERSLRVSGGYPKFISEGLNDDYLPIWLQEGGVNTYYVGKL